jgi:hypothetical protein
MALIVGLIKEEKLTYSEVKQINVGVVQHTGIGEVSSISYSELLSTLFKIKF